VTSSVADPRWERLTAPAKAALRWAWASAVVRSGREAEPADAAVDSLDVLIGVLLADLPDSPARRLFEYFGVPLGEVLRRPGAESVTAPALLGALERLPDLGALPLDSVAEGILQNAVIRNVADGPDAQVSLKALFGALLETRSPASTQISDALSVRQVEFDAVTASYRNYLVGRQPYRDFLRERFPYRPPLVELPDYLADQPHVRGPAVTEEPPDLVGVGAEVDAFARLVASKRLVPPLAVGLFGDWGSGKSYFLRGLQRRVDAISAGAAATPDRAAPFHASIVQVEFNAWQYVGGDLWASLIEHLFRNLRVSGDDSDDLLAQRQRYWVERVQGATADHQAAHVAKAGFAEQHRVAEETVAERERERVAAVAALERARRERPLAGWRPGEQLWQVVRDAAAGAGLDVVLDDAAQLADELDRTRTELRGAAAVLLPLRTGGWRYATAVIAVLLLTPLVAFGLQLLDLSAVTAAAGVVAWVLSTAIGYLALAGRFVRGVTGRVAAAQTELVAAEQADREKLDRQVVDAQRTVDRVQAELHAAVDREQELAVKVTEATLRLAASTPGQVLTEFITDRLDSDDYRRHLGVPALVRRDLERLSRLVAAHQHDPDAVPVPGQYAIDRIVLYIDDLDRCPAPLVVKVLEVVHLLLAFPLFVVVVAVDSRWLASSLDGHYDQFGGSGASPEDYLEKVFQVPFWVRPLGPEIRRQMLRGLLTPSLASPARAQARAAGEVVDVVVQTDLLAFRALVDSFHDTEGRRASADAVDLCITTDELSQVEDVADLLGRTPRAVKRFVNVYLLLKSMGIGRGWTMPAGGQLVVLLAIANGLPRFAAVVLPVLAAAEPGRTLGDLLPRPAPDDPWAAEYEMFRRWLDAVPGRHTMEPSGLCAWTDLVVRFRFTRA